MPVILTQYPSVRARQGQTRALDLLELVHYLTEFEKREEKDGPCFTLGECSGRGSDAVRDIPGMGLDFDKCSPGEVPHLEHADNLEGYWQVWHTTHSHTEDAPRWRCFLLFSRPVSAQEYRALWPVVFEILGQDPAIDASVHDPARLWYAPAARPGAPYEREFVHGAALDVDALLRDAPVTSGTTPSQGQPLSAEVISAYLPADGPEAQKALDALGFIDPDCGMKEWVMVGMALQCAFGQAGLQIWEDWSARGEKWQLGECARRWRSFNPRPDGVTLGTIYKAAKASGWVEPEAPRPAFLDQPAPVSTATELLNAADVAADGAPFAPWLIHNVIRQGHRVLVAAPPKAGKSGVMLDMMLALATGTPWLEHLVERPIRCLWVQAEMRYDDVRARLQAHPITRAAAGKPDQIDLLRNLQITPQWSRPLDEAGAKALIELANSATHPPELIVIDPLIAVLDGDENDNAEMRDLLYHRLEVLRTAINPDAALVLVHHARKAPSGGEQADPFSAIRGAGALRGWYDMGIIIDYQPGDPVRALRFEGRSGSPDPIPIAYHDGAWPRYTTMASAAPEDLAQKAQDTLERMLATAWAARTPYDGTREDIRAVLAQRTGCSHNEARAAISLLKEAGVWAQVRVAGNRNVWAPVGPNADSPETARMQAADWIQ